MKTTNKIMEKLNIDRITFAFVVVSLIVVASVTCYGAVMKSADPDMSVICNIPKISKKYARVLGTKERWQTLRDTLDYAIENPWIDEEHPNISKTLNPEKKNKNANKDEKLQIRFEPKNILEETDKLSQMKEFVKVNETQEEIIELQEECFDKLAQLEKKIKKGKTDYKICYQTFDDGPSARTDKILRRLDKYHIQATFFTTTVNGKRCFDNKKKKTAPFYKKYVKYGHTIANHTYTHDIFGNLYNSKKSFIKAIDKQEKHVRKLTGYTTNIYRFPGGSPTAGNLRKPIIKELRKKGYVWIDWTAQTGDGGSLKSTKQAFKNFKSSMDEPIEVVLCHDYSDKTYKILPKMIKYARKHHYIYAPLFYESKVLNH